MLSYIFIQQVSSSVAKIKLDFNVLVRVVLSFFALLFDTRCGKSYSHFMTVKMSRQIFYLDKFLKI